MVNSRCLHDHIKAKILSALSGRPLSWLAEKSGVPQSTLSTQMLRPKFSLEVLLKVSAALERDITDFLPEPQVRAAATPGSEELLQDVERLLEAIRARYGTLSETQQLSKNGYRVRKSDVG